MITNQIPSQASPNPILPVLEILQAALSAPGLQEFCTSVVTRLSQITPGVTALIYLADPRLPNPYFAHSGCDWLSDPEMETLCASSLVQIHSQPVAYPLVEAIPGLGNQPARLELYPLQAQNQAIGLIGIIAAKSSNQTGFFLLESLAGLLAGVVDGLIERLELVRQVDHLNTYLTVSSMLSQALDLHELLEMTLYCCMETVSAEAASILLLDEEKLSFRFYQAEGPAKPLLVSASFPAEQGLAGAVLQSQQSEVIKDVQSDSRFYREVDSESGFTTRNMVAVPLTAGEEKVGVLEVLNKVNEGAFSEDERLLLVSIAEEIAFAIRNAMLFEYVVNTYCKQRQGLNTCRGCQRPLGSWTPCVKYRSASI